ncbi:MAG: hypothetical protein AAFZ15_27510 [Bacteroidota bacterium]
MKNTFLEAVFEKLSTKDLKQLEKFVASPYFNGRPQVIRLLSILVSTRQQNQPIDKEMAFAECFTEKPFDDQLWRLTLSQLYKLIEHWLAIRETKKNLSFPKLPLSKAYRQMGLEKHYQRSINALQQNLERANSRSAEYYEIEYQREWEKYAFLTSGKRTENFNLQELSNTMDIAFIARKIRLACLAISHEAVFKTKYDLGLLPSVLRQIESSPALLTFPPIALYYYCYLALTENDEKHFDTLISSLTLNVVRLPPEDQRHLYLLAINFGIRQINASRPAYDRPVLELYKIGLENEFLIHHGRLSHFTFNNIVAIAVRIGEIQWVEDFINTYQVNLERRHRKVAYSLGMARLCHATRDYKRALLHLQNADYKDFINNIIAKILQMKIYFETGEFEVLEAHLRNMKSYIQRKRTLGYHRSNYLTIIRFTQALMELNPYDRASKKVLLEEIKAAKKLTEKEWLLKMLNR